MNRTLVGVFCLVMLSLPARADNATFNHAVQSYSSGSYARALSEFETLHSQFPNNALVRYYEALCLQATGKFAQAKAEFSFVSSCNDPKLKAMAQAGIDGLSRAHISTSPRSANSSSSNSTSADAPGKIKRVLEFYADWCGPCRAFAPAFDEVKATTSGVQFERFNIDETQGKELSQKYPFPTIPHAVFLDGSGKVLFNGDPNRDVDSFRAQIKRFQ